MNALRQTLRSRRKALSLLYRQQAAANLAESARVDKLLKAWPAQRIAVYLSMPEEINLNPLITALWERGIETCLPVLHPFRPYYLWFAPYHENSTLYRDCFDIPVPEFLAKTVLAPWEMDMVLVPLVGFDRKGQRMGMGGGCYDRSFAFRSQGIPMPLVGCAFDCQQTSELTSQPWDQPLDAVMTETRLLFFDHQQHNA